MIVTIVPNTTSTSERSPSPERTVISTATPVKTLEITPQETPVKNESNKTEYQEKPEVTFRIPGFGVIAALIVIGISALRWKRLR